MWIPFVQSWKYPRSQKTPGSSLTVYAGYIKSLVPLEHFTVLCRATQDSNSGQSPNIHNYPDMEAVPLLLNNMKADPSEDSLSTDHFQTQTEPVDLSINKARSSPTAASSSPVSMTASASSPSSTSTSSSSRPASSPTVITSVSSAASVPSVLTPGPLVASASGVGGQQFLHIIHPVPPSSPMNLQSNKMSHVHRIPVVVQSVPVVYTAVRSPGNMNNTIVVPLLEDGRSHVKGKVEPVLCICGISKTTLVCGECNHVIKLLVSKLNVSFAEKT
ncbi:PREDICTED: Krueppel-like factor 12 [Cariama cristata]|uniref:Krueppel-like factor 12 n=1 Tax=Cariama cristata TaxID=54380 RepID=UPI0005203A94|nr:PREDICTED: Krueppel-like factor 12 [Cariama cristata]